MIGTEGKVYEMNHADEIAIDDPDGENPAPVRHAHPRGSLSSGHARSSTGNEWRRHPPRPTHTRTDACARERGPIRCLDWSL